MPGTYAFRAIKTRIALHKHTATQFRKAHNTRKPARRRNSNPPKEANIRVFTGREEFKTSRVRSGQVWSGRVGSGRVGSGRVGSGRVGSGRVGSGRVGSGGGLLLNRGTPNMFYNTLCQMPQLSIRPVERSIIFFTICQI